MKMTVSQQDTPHILGVAPNKLLNSNLLLYRPLIRTRTKVKRLDIFPSPAIVGHFKPQHFQSISLMLLKYRR